MFTTQNKENIIIIKLNEIRVDMVIARKFQDLLNQQIESRPMKVILDFDITESLDSSAMSVLVAFQKSISNYGGELILCNLTRTLITLFKLSRLDSYFEFSDESF